MKATIRLIIVALIFRLVFAGGTGLESDEAYMVAASHSFDASYFDHPLASWWLELAARALTGSVAPGVVRLPFVALSAVTCWLLFIITKRLFDARAGFWAVVAYTIAPVFSVMSGCFVMPDGPVDAALAAFVYALIRALGLPDAKPQPDWWLLVGVFAGLALDSKYNAALVIAGTGIGILLAPDLRAALLRPQAWLAGLIALAMISPMLWWNASHHWISFRYQGERADGHNLRLFMPFVVWGGEALAVLPWVWLPMVAAQIQALRAGPAQAGGWLLAWAGLLPVVGFAGIGLWSSTHILAHWAAPGELLLLPLFGRWARDVSPRPRNIVALVSGAAVAGVMLFFVAEVQFGCIPHIERFAKFDKWLLLEAFDWTSLGAQIPAGIDVVDAQRWYDAGKVGYGLERAGVNIPVTVFASEIHEFKYSAPPQSFVGKTVLVLSMPWTMAQTASFCAGYFKSLTPGPVLAVKVHGEVLLTIPTYIGRDMIAPPVPAPNSPGITGF